MTLNQHHSWPTNSFTLIRNRHLSMMFLVSPHSFHDSGHRHVHGHACISTTAVVALVSVCWWVMMSLVLVHQLMDMEEEIKLLTSWRLKLAMTGYHCHRSCDCHCLLCTVCLGSRNKSTSTHDSLLKNASDQKKLLG